MGIFCEKGKKRGHRSLAKRVVAEVDLDERGFRDERFAERVERQRDLGDQTTDKDVGQIRDLRTYVISKGATGQKISYSECLCLVYECCKCLGRVHPDCVSTQIYLLNNRRVVSLQQRGYVLCRLEFERSASNVEDGH